MRGRTSWKIGIPLFLGLFAGNLLFLESAIGQTNSFSENQATLKEKEEDPTPPRLDSSAITTSDTAVQKPWFRTFSFHTPENLKFGIMVPTSVYTRTNNINNNLAISKAGDVCSRLAKIPLFGTYLLPTEAETDTGFTRTMSGGTLKQGWGLGMKSAGQPAVRLNDFTLSTGFNLFRGLLISSKWVTTGNLGPRGSRALSNNLQSWMGLPNSWMGVEVPAKNKALRRQIIPLFSMYRDF